jgi:predicted phosphodiesterase
VTTGPVWIASDWHLSPASPAAHSRLAAAFLARARAAGASVVLNGDVFDELFAGPGRAEAAHRAVALEIEALAREGRLRRTRGNHDPAGGEERLVLDRPSLGRVLVSHGHAADPVNASALGRLGEAISRRFGRLGPVRGAAALAERTLRALAGRRVGALFRRRCLGLVEAGGFDLGVFGHVHAAHLVPGDRYANAGSLLGGILSYIVLDGAEARLCALRLEDLSDPPLLRNASGVD